MQTPRPEAELPLSARALGLAVIAIAVAAPVAAPRRALAQVAGLRTIVLGEGIAVRQTRGVCDLTPGLPCPVWWEPIGMSFEAHPELAVATTFAVTASGRIVAMLPRAAELQVGMTGRFPVGPRVMTSDDRGASWQVRDWADTVVAATEMAFEPAGPRGVAVDRAGRVWSTEDQGSTWRSRRSAGGVGFGRAWVRGRTVVLEGLEGALWLSRDLGFALESLAPRGGAVVEEADGALRVTTGDRALRIAPDGAMRRL